jgi:hypothetical protein
MPLRPDVSISPTRRGSPLRLAAGATLALTVAAGGCTSPLWRFDRYTVEGAFSDATCNITIDGRPVMPDAVLPDVPVQVMRDFMYDPTLPPGQGVKSLRCLGMIFLIVSPEGTLPASGRYRIVDASLSDVPGTTIMNVYRSHVGPGLWPFALTGVHLVATDGVLQLDAMTDSTVRGTFRAVARREASGE